MDCDIDQKLEELEAEYGLEGFGLYVRILQWAYKDRSGEVVINDQHNPKWALWVRRTGIEEDKLKRMVEYMLHIGLFSQSRYDSDGTLTSGGIQKRIGEVNKKRDSNRAIYGGRNNTETRVSAGFQTPETLQKLENVVSAGFQTPETLQKLGFQQGFSGVSDVRNPAETPQSKVKERKEKEKKVNCSPDGEYTPVESPDKPPKERKLGPSQEVLELMQYFYKSYEHKFNQKYFAQNFNNDSRIFKDLLAGGLGPTKIPVLIDAFFEEDEDEFVKNSTYTTGLFKSVIHKYLSKINPNRSGNRVLKVK